MTNPLLETWTAPFGAPPLDRIETRHFAPAFEAALAEHNAQIAAIARNPAPPTFANVIAAWEDAGEKLRLVGAVFNALTSAKADDALQALELEMAPRLTAHHNAVYLNTDLFARMDAVHAARDTLAPEDRRLVERIHLDFVRTGAGLDTAARAALDAITQELSTLGTRFAQNVMGDEDEYLLPLSEDKMAGLPDSAREAAAATAQARGIAQPYAVTLSRSEVEPALQFAHDREVRETLFKAFTARGANAGERDNRPLIGEILSLRARQAKLLGYENYAAFKLADTMAGKVENARALMERVWTPAKKRAEEERADLETLIAEEGGNFALQPWDWRYYAERLKARRHAFDDAELKPYFTLENMIAAAFYTAERLFGLSFHPRHDVPVFHPDMRVWEVRKGDQPIGLFYGDYFARPGKQGGAWMSSFRDQSAGVLPLVTNSCNFVKSDPAMLSFDDARTLFHEFGHALHGLLSSVTWPTLSGTNVARDFVELPSQLFEHWLEEKEILTRFARHFQTNAPLPGVLMDKLLAARTYGQGFATVEFLASAFLDMDFHSSADGKFDAFTTLKNIGMPQQIVPRHAAAHFGHVFAGDGYSAGYYSYLWSEVLDADGFGAFEADPFDPAAAQKLYQHIYSTGGTRDFASSYRAFRGRDPDVKALLKGRGLENEDA